MSIRKTVQELRGAAENSEASGFDNGQAQSVIEAIAVSIERFAVTPEVLVLEFAKQNKEIEHRFAEQNEAIDTLITRQFTQFREEFDRRFTEQSKEFDSRIAAQDKAWDARFAEQNEDMNRQFTELRAAIKSIGTRQFAMMWGVIVVMLGLLATNFVQQVL